jgi:hypothetical protein
VVVLSALEVLSDRVEDWQPELYVDAGWALVMGVAGVRRA